MIDEEIAKLARDAARAARARTRAQPDRGVVPAPGRARRRVRRQGEPAERVLHATPARPTSSTRTWRATDRSTPPTSPRRCATSCRADRRVELVVLPEDEAMSDSAVQAGPGKRDHAVLAGADSSTLAVALALPAGGPADARPLEAADARSGAGAHAAGRAEAHPRQRPAACGCSSTTKCRWCRRTSWCCRAPRPMCPGQFGAASMTAAMLDEGAAGKAALALADSVEFLGAQLSTCRVLRRVGGAHVHAGGEAARGARTCSPTCARDPTSPPQELDRLRTERLTGLLQARDDPAALVGLAFPRLLFGPEHRYGTSAGGTEASLKALGVDELRAFHRGHYRPDNAVLIVVGDVTPAALRPLARPALRRVEGRPAPPPPPFPVRASPQPGKRQIYHRRQARRRAVADPHRPGGRAALHADYVALDVLNTILGGSFTSRLNRTCARRTATPTAPARASTCAARPGRSRPAPACRPTRPPMRSRSSSTS